MDEIIIKSKKYLSVITSFVIMLSIGSIYAWSIFADELIKNYNWYSYQTQLVFGMVIAIFPFTMLILRKFRNLHLKLLLFISAILLSMGYLLAGFSNNNFLIVLIGIGILTGIATGIGYLISLSVPIIWFPQKKGFVMGIIVSGFGLAAVLLSFFADMLLSSGKNIFQVFKFIGITYGTVMILLSFIFPSSYLPNEKYEYKTFKFNKTIKKLTLGIFLGTFAGLLIIGSLKPIGSQMGIDSHTLVISVSFFAISNFLGRIIWGSFSDKIYTSFVIFFALLIQSITIISILFIPVNNYLFIIISSLIGFSFGGNFVLFAKETSSKFGAQNFSYYYPIIFLGYAVAGILGPLVGGSLYDIFNNYNYSIVAASFFSFIGSIIFLNIQSIKKIRNVSTYRN